jgi:DNA-binding LacI/PurR family transcriptional regulator
MQPMVCCISTPDRAKDASLAGANRRDTSHKRLATGDGSGRVGIVTMRDIARATGLSQSTVSRVLNRTPTVVPIADATRERVLAMAKELGYRPNPLARGLRQGSRPTGIASVSVDNRAGIQAVLQHVADLGHRRIAYAGAQPLGDIKEREEAYVDFMARLGEPVRDGYIDHRSNEFAGGVAALKQLLGLPEPPTAVVTSTDVLAIGALHAAHACGLQVPADVSVAGFDDIPVAAVTVPALTTARMPVREMVAKAVQMVLGDHPLDPTRPTVLPPSLMVRASTGPPPG